MANTVLIAVLVLVALIVVLIMLLRPGRKGKINITLDKYQYSPGDSIKGKIELAIKKPIKSKKLEVGLVGTKKTTQRRMSHGRHSTQRRSQKIFDFKLPIHQEKEYAPSQSSHDFEIKIPRNLLDSSAPSGVGKIIVGTLSALSGRHSSIKWHVVANLDIPGFDISKRIQVNIA